MDLLNHDLAQEFPEHLEKMRELKTTDAHFAKLFTEYDEGNHDVKKYEMGAAAISDEGLEELKKKRLLLKDEIYEILQRA
jgi:uncharacterized protein YdcH (DUF465 family)